MKRLLASLAIFLGMTLGVSISTIASTQAVLAKNPSQDSPCAAILTEATKRAGINADNTEWYSDKSADDGWDCYVSYNWAINYGAQLRIESMKWGSVPIDCTDEYCQETSFHGYPAMSEKQACGRNFRWYMEREGKGYLLRVEKSHTCDNVNPQEVLDLAEVLWSVAEEQLPGTSSTPVTPVQANSDCAGVTVDKLRAGGVSVLACRLHCDPNILSDTELQACIDQYSGQSTGEIPVVPGNPPTEENTPPQENLPGSEETPPIPVEPTDDEQPKNLGPLATTPFVPLAGALIGSALGWMISVAATSGNVLSSLFNPTPRPGPIPASLKGAAQPSTVEPITPETTTNNPTTPDVPAPTEPPKSAGEQLWDMTSNLVGSSSTVIGSLSEFFDFQEDTETLKKLHESLKAWQNNPTRKGAETYLKNLRNTTNVRLSNLSKQLGNVANVIDGIDALSKGLEKAAERGYTGSDKILAIGGEGAKKVMNYALTKNPVVGLVNSALGSATEMYYGKDGRIDIGTIIETGSDAWDKTTQQYAEYTGGDWIAPSNESFGEVMANDPVLRRKDQYLHSLRQIKKMVEQGKISLKEGSERIRQLRSALMGGE